MARIRLLHWKASEASKYLSTLAALGHTVQYHGDFDARSLRDWRARPPDAFIIDLSRLPAQGREIAIALRQSPATRVVPLVFCQGAPDKVEKIRALLPDALYCEFSKLRGVLRQALARAPAVVTVPAAMMERYKTRTPAQKLGIAPGNTVAVVDPPSNYLSILGDLPENVKFTEDNGGQARVTLCFVHDLPSLEACMSELRSTARTSKLWFSWRKGKTAVNGVSGYSIRATGVSLGLVDYKICSLNQAWSGMLFALKR